MKWFILHIAKQWIHILKDDVMSLRQIKYSARYSVVQVQISKSSYL